nr:ubiquitin-like protein-NEDD8-like protein RUB3 [Ipomoea batatas]
MDLIFELQRGTQFTIEIGYFDTVQEIKEKVQKYQGIPASTQTLVFNGNVLQDDLNVSFKPLPATTTTSSGSSGNTNSSKKLRITVLSQCETKKIPMEMNPSENVGELRKELERLKEQWQLELQDDGYFFIYKQNVMDDDRSFRWHNVGQGDTIEIFNGSVTGGG